MPDRFTGLLGVFVILGLAFALSNNRRAINYRLVGTGLAVQLGLALFILKTAPGKWIFKVLGDVITKILNYSDKGADFVFGALVNHDVMQEIFGPAHAFIFFFKVVPTIIFVAVLVSMAYHLGILQRVVSVMARVMNAVMRVSGAEALSNIASIFVGQVEAQIMIKPYVPTMTKSELLASMAGSMACIAGGVMAIYIALGVPAEYLLAASIMAAPGALVISKIVYPETEQPATKGSVKLHVEKTSSNLIDAISHGASEGLQIALNVVAMLIAFIALIALVDYALVKLGTAIVAYTGFNLDGAGFDLNRLSIQYVLGKIFSLFAFVMGVPGKDIQAAGELMGTKLVLNEFVAYVDLIKIKGGLEPKTLAIVTFALCGFANFSSIGIQVGGIGALAPSRRKDLSELGFKALICGTLASYLSATIAGILL